jgi:2-polyprenyl-3-methyl-5-hydroxy-6-metoxy-1,4-benzoquinol methylase
MDNSNAHNNWAKYYDFVYEKTYGYFYEHFTNETLNTIEQIIPNGKIIDFGAGTGRLSIPLARKGYEVIAIEKSRKMAKVIESKKGHLGNITIKNSLAQEDLNNDADLVICVFTVLSYMLYETVLEEEIKNIKNSLKESGYFLFDVPSKIFFNTQQLINIENKDFIRKVSLMPTDEESIYKYKEYCKGLWMDKNFEYEDEFSIKYWDTKTVNSLLDKYGFTKCDFDLSKFSNTGSTYQLFQNNIND